MAAVLSENVLDPNGPKWWVGVFHVKGWGAKKFGMSFETQDIPGFAGISRGSPEMFEKEKFAFKSRPLEMGFAIFPWHTSPAPWIPSQTRRPGACARLHENFGEAWRSLANFREPTPPYP